MMRHDLHKDKRPYVSTNGWETIASFDVKHGNDPLDALASERNFL
jgi:hypothetical protein